MALPRPGIELDNVLVPVRKGQWALERFLELVNKHLLPGFDRAIANSTLPETVDPAAISSILVVAYQKHWQEQDDEPGMETIADIYGESQ